MIGSDHTGQAKVGGGEELESPIRLEGRELHRKVTFKPTPKGVEIARERGGEEGRQAPSGGKSRAKA